MATPALTVAQGSIQIRKNGVSRTTLQVKDITGAAQDLTGFTYNPYFFPQNPSADYSGDAVSAYFAMVGDASGNLSVTSTIDAPQHMLSTSGTLKIQASNDSFSTQVLAAVLSCQTQLP